MGNHEEILGNIQEALIGLDGDRVDGLVDESLDQKVPPLAIINDGLVAGLRKMGDMFEKGEIFIPHIMVAAEIVEKNSARLRPLLEAGGGGEKKGTVVIGTVEGDIHDLGKNLVGTLLSIAGYNVIDLGKDVPCAAFLEGIQKEKADFLFLSALMTTTMVRQEEMIQLLAEKGLSATVKVAVGGAPVTLAWAQKIGAAGYASDAVDAVRMADELL
jgi:corrinoid protein of di/trimethylamine methyltransferase